MSISPKGKIIIEKIVKILDTVDFVEQHNFKTLSNTFKFQYLQINNKYYGLEDGNYINNFILYPSKTICVFVSRSTFTFDNP